MARVATRHARHSEWPCWGACRELQAAAGNSPFCFESNFDARRSQSAVSKLITGRVISAASMAEREEQEAAAAKVFAGIGLTESTAK